MQQPKKRRTVVRGVKAVQIRPVHRKPMNTELIAQCLLDIVHQAADSDIERWAKLGQESLQDIYGPDWRSLARRAQPSR
jgi:hypothetical protein